MKKDEIDAAFEEAKNIHAVYRAFCKRFQNKENKWKFNGFKFIKQVHKYVETHPEIKIVNCDDAVFASSLLVLIPHSTKKDYMGTTVLFIPQCTGEEATQMFLYPDHEKNLVASLTKMRSKYVN